MSFSDQECHQFEHNFEALESFDKFTTYIKNIKNIYSTLLPCLLSKMQERVPMRLNCLDPNHCLAINVSRGSQTLE